ncbi:MAG: hypothetical protein AAF718_04065 [Pseudomonadota bacterium]
MLYSKLCAASALTLLMAQAAVGQCFMCDEVIELDQAGATCFLADYASYEEALAGGAEFVEVDISCAQRGTTGTRGGVEVMPKLGERPIKRTVFTFDEAYLSCLRGLLDGMSDEIDPTITFDLAAQCQN